MGSHLLRMLGVFDCEEDPRWKEDYDSNLREKASQDFRFRQARLENLFWRLHGIDQMVGLKIARGVWGDDEQQGRV